MNIKEINELTEDGFPIASITQSVIKTIGPIQEGTNGNYQIVTIQQDDDTLKLRIKCANLFLDPNEDDLKEISFMSGKPVKGKPVGIIFRNTNGKKIVNITEHANMKLITPIETQEGSFDPEESQLTETNDTQLSRNEVAACCERGTSEQLTEFEEGPSDDYFLGLLEDRWHLYQLTRKFFAEKVELPIESLSAITTGLIMDNVYAKKQVRHKKSTPKPEKYGKIEKPHNPPKEEAKEEVTSSGEDLIAEWVKTQKGKAHYDQMDSKGTKLGVIMMDRERRRASITWYYGFAANDKTPGPKTIDIYKSIGAFIRCAPSSIASAMVYDVIAYNVKGEDYDTAPVEDIIEPVAQEHSEADARKLAMLYFKSE